MPDQERGVRFLQTLNKDQPEAGVRCSSCPSYRVTFQTDCVCCGREVTLDQDSNAGVNSDKTYLSVKSELVEAAVPKPASQVGLTPENQAFKGRRTSRGRQRLSRISVLRNFSSFHRPIAERESGIGSRVLLPASSRNIVKVFQESTHNVVLRSSFQREGRRPAVKVGAHQDFKGVRTRRGVKGFLVEIRPHKWKKTIWLGTYKTDVEAAGAFDAGVFYTNKPNTKYNFCALKAAFPPLPSHLSLDQPDNMEEIKCFVQKQAKLAAAAARRMCINDTKTTSNPQPHNQDLQVEVKVELLASADRASTTARVDVTSTSNSQSCLTNASPRTPDAEHDDGFLDAIDMDMDYLQGPIVDEEAAESWIAEYTNYLSTLPDGGLMS